MAFILFVWFYFRSVHDIDVYSAGLAEYYVPGGFVGPTFGSILGQQYKRVKFGDRYWFEHGNEAGSFTPGMNHLIFIGGLIFSWKYILLHC